MAHKEHTARRTYERHGMLGTPEYRAWRTMRDRCYRPKSNQYHNYGARGITVCKDWRESFAAFYRDVGPRGRGEYLALAPGAIEYGPETCRWSRHRQYATDGRPAPPQALTHGGETLSIRDWATRLGVSTGLIYRRLARGLPAAEVLTTRSRPATKSRMLTHAGRTLSLLQWCGLTGLPAPTILHRLQRGWPVGRALDTPTYTSVSRAQATVGREP